LKVKETTHSILNTVSGAACPDEIGDHGFCNLLLIKFLLQQNQQYSPTLTQKRQAAILLRSIN